MLQPNQPRTEIDIPAYLIEFTEAAALLQQAQENEAERLHLIALFAACYREARRRQGLGMRGTFLLPFEFQALEQLGIVPLTFLTAFSIAVEGELSDIKRANLYLQDHPDLTGFRADVFFTINLQ